MVSRSVCTILEICASPRVTSSFGSPRRVPLRQINRAFGRDHWSRSLFPLRPCGLRRIFSIGVCLAAIVPIAARRVDRACTVEKNALGFGLVEKVTTIQTNMWSPSVPTQKIQRLLLALDSRCTYGLESHTKSSYNRATMSNMWLFCVCC
jgi:hypothetical protein